MEKHISVFVLVLALLLTSCGAPPVEDNNGNKSTGQEMVDPADTTYTWQELNDISEWSPLLRQMPLYDENSSWGRPDELCTVDRNFGWESWTNRNVLSKRDATYVYTSFFNGVDDTQCPWFDGEVDGTFIMGKAIPATDIEPRLLEQADRVFGIGMEELHGARFYLSRQKVYILPSGLGGGGDDTYRIEKIITVDDYAIVLQRKWNSLNGDEYDWNLRPKEEGTVTVLYKDSGDVYYHYLSNYCVKDIDRYLQDSSVSNSTVQKPASTENEILKHVTAEDGLRLRTGAGTDYDTIYTLPYGCPVIVLHSENDWCFVEFNGTLGWMSSGYLEE